MEGAVEEEPVELEEARVVDGKVEEPGRLELPEDSSDDTLADRKKVVRAKIDSRAVVVVVARHVTE